MAQGGNLSEPEKVDSTRVLDNLREALQGLACSRVHQPTMALDLASNFECVSRFASEALAGQMSEMQVQMLCSMQEYIDFMHTLAPGVWSETAIDDHACWQQLKKMAEQALGAFAWNRCADCDAAAERTQ
jgi:hypothetical protein